MPSKVLPKLNVRTRRAIAGIGEQIRVAREAAGVSQETLAKKIGMTRTNYARIEHGGSNATIETLIRVADGLDLEFSFVLEQRPRGRR